MSHLLEIYSDKVLLPDGMQPARVVIHDGIIKDIIKGQLGGDQPDKSLVLMPGLIDSHVHINEPGTDWEGFDTATRAAAVGGITTLVDMPLNSLPVTTTKSALIQKIEAAKNSIHVNCGFWGGIVPESIGHVEELWESGVLGFKSFLIHSGLDEFPNMTLVDLHKAFTTLKKIDAVLLVHCELEGEGSTKIINQNPQSYRQFLASRPESWENDAIALVIRLAEEFNTRVHVVHLSSAESIEQLQSAKDRGVKITVETCPHYLYFNADNIPDANSLYKCTPPIRSAKNNDALWGAVKSGLIDFIVSDHSPCPPDMKSLEDDNLLKAWGGISGLQFSLSAIWTQASKRGITIKEVSDLMSWHIAKFLQIEHRKGKIAIGYDADIMLWNPDKSFEVSASDIKSRHRISPYVGQTMQGMVHQTYVGGRLVYDRDSFVNLHTGQILLRDSQ